MLVSMCQAAIINHATALSVANLSPDGNFLVTVGENEACAKVASIEFVTT